MREDLNVEQIEDQLRSYGSWLEQRSDVALSNVDRGAVSVDVAASGVAEGMAPDGDWDGRGPNGFERPAIGRRLLAAGAAVFVAGAAFFVIADTNGNEGAVTAAGDAATGVGSEVQTAPAADGAAPVLDVQDTTPESTADAAEASGSVAEAEADGQASGSDASSDTDETAAANGDTEDATPASTETTAPDASDDETSTSQPEAPADPLPAGDSMTFLSPPLSTAIDLNLGATFRVAPVDGAVSYTFVGGQNGAEVLRTTVTEPTFLLPGQLAAFTAGWPLEAGVLTVEVVASDNTGAVLARDSIEVALLPGGGAPRRGVPGQVLPTIPTIPEG